MGAMTLGISSGVGPHSGKQGKAEVMPWSQHTEPGKGDARPRAHRIRLRWHWVPGLWSQHAGVEMAWDLGPQYQHMGPGGTSTSWIWVHRSDPETQGLMRLTTSPESLIWPVRSKVEHHWSKMWETWFQFLVCLNGF